jgi:hypothetical protein
LLSVLLPAIVCAPAAATPVNKAALERYFGRFLPRKMAACSTCHLAAT